MQIHGAEILDTFAEGFAMRYTRLIVTAHDAHWLDAAVREMTGYSASVIACDAEAGLERWIGPPLTPDGRLGAAVMVFGFSTEAVGKAVANRVGQCVMTCPTTAVYNGLEIGPDSAKDRVPLGKQLRYFGDGYQKSKQLGGQRFWRVPVMDGEFLVDEWVGVAKGVGGGNVILQAASLEAGLAAARRGVEAIANMSDVITPFPGGVARSGSKVGSRYKKLVASTADAYCPTLKGRVESQLLAETNCAYEIVIDGASEAAVAAAMAAVMRAIPGEGVLAIGAGNYGGKLGKYHFRLHDILKATRFG